MIIQKLNKMKTFRKQKKRRRKIGVTKTLDDRFKWQYIPIKCRLKLNLYINKNHLKIESCFKHRPFLFLLF